MKRFLQTTLTFGLMLAVVAGIGVRRVQARMFGNPAYDLGAGNLDAGLGLSNVAKEFSAKIPLANGTTVTGTETDSVSHTTLFLDYGVGPKGVLRGELAQVKFGIGGSSGTEFGGSYRQSFSTRTLQSGKVLTWGGLVGFWTGNISGSNFGFTESGSYTDFAVAGGGSIAIQKGFNAYFAAVLDQVDGTISGSGFKYTFTSNDPVGAYGGVDFVLSPEIKIGGEYHLIFEQGWAIYGTFKF